MDHKDSLEQQIFNAQQIKQITRTPGWKHVNNHFENVLIGIMEKLLYCDDMNEVRRLQERFRGFFSMLEYFDSNEQLEDHYKQQLKDIEDFDVYNKEFALNQ